MSATLYTCDRCEADGYYEGMCHPKHELSVAPDGKVICEGCADSFYSSDDEWVKFVPPLEQQVQELEREQQELVYDCRDHRIAKEAAEQQLQALQNPWISVGEQWPPECTPVLVKNMAYPDDTFAALTTWEDAEGSSGWCWHRFYGHNLADGSDYEFDDDYQFTHWMPLPEPPEQQRGGQDSE